MIDLSDEQKEINYTILNMPLVDILVYKLKIYRLLPWKYGGDRLFQWPTRVRIKNQWKEYEEK